MSFYTQCTCNRNWVVRAQRPDRLTWGLILQPTTHQPLLSRGPQHPGASAAKFAYSLGVVLFWGKKPTIEPETLQISKNLIHFSTGPGKIGGHTHICYTHGKVLQREFRTQVLNLVMPMPVDNATQPHLPLSGFPHAMLAIITQFLPHGAILCYFLPEEHLQCWTNKVFSRGRWSLVLEGVAMS